ncbi:MULTISPECIES: hypothetical protein [Gordonibacter]|uniref:Phage tail protein n=1 Tax=Gordonibacter faecis TaxID=3047475 RepID=A0ABT7DQ07_9ACTN|nr:MULTISPECIES: hypothetical protein [unclassified Gordonibacter]MDJ1651626.1 hypothetical protein [Gordonibacter sp. KGMB12511]HIW77048.1 hypothetical protein [Candidatus Gordonibacter avicola]
MTQNAANVFTAKPKVGGAVWSGALTIAPPTDAVTALPDGINSLGYMHEDGITESVETDNESIAAMGGDKVHVVRTTHDVTFKFHPIETNRYVLAEQYGDENVTVGNDGNIAVKYNANEAPARLYVLELLLDATHVMRVVIPNGKVTEVGEVKYGSSDPIGAELTITALPDKDGNKAYKYFSEIKPTSGSEA